MMFDFAFDTADFSVQHDSQLLGVFEPVSAIMFLNIDDGAFDDWRRASLEEETPAEGTEQLTEVFWHEAYHCFQTYTTGYLYEQFSRLADIWSEHRHSMWPVIAPRLGRHLLDKAADAFSVCMSSNARRMMSDARRHQANLNFYQRLHRRSVKHGQKSIAGTHNPRLYPAIEGVRASWLAHGADGLSAKDVIEGAAFAYGREMTYPGCEDRLHDTALDADGQYQRLITITAKYCSGRPLGVIMRAAAALALQYERPGVAYVPLLIRLAAARSGDEIPAARSLSRELPHFPDAGRILGTASETQIRLDHKSPNLYFSQLDRLRTGAWGIDELDLLIDTRAIDAIPTGELGFAVVTRDGRRGFKDQRMMAKRLMIGTTMLPTGPSVAQLRRQLIRSIM